MRLYDSGIDPELLAIFQSQLDRSLHYQFIDELQHGRSQTVEGTVEGVVLGNRLSIEMSEAAQRVAIGNALAQLTILPIFDPHQDQRAQDLGWGQAVPVQLGSFQSTLEIASDLLDQLLVLCEQVGNGR